MERQPYPMTLAVLAVALLAAASCASTTTLASGSGELAPAAAGETTRPPPAREIGRPAQPRHVEADTRFMRNMILHHAQALEMTGLVADRSEQDDVRRLAQRIEVSQRDEIALMKRWLEKHGEEVPAMQGHGAHGDHALMPGMATAEEMVRLAAATGADFDRLFLELMIRHHDGALVMVKELFATEGAGQEAEIFQFASHVDTDQRMEIRRMGAMLAAQG